MLRDKLMWINSTQQNECYSNIKDFDTQDINIMVSSKEMMPGNWTTITTEKGGLVSPSPRLLQMLFSVNCSSTYIIHVNPQFALASSLLPHLSAVPFNPYWPVFSSYPSSSSHLFSLLVSLILTSSPICSSFTNPLLPSSLLSFPPPGGEVATPRFTQYFRGSLSGLTIRPGRIETQKVISCLQACKEGLDINSLESLAKDIKVCLNKRSLEERNEKQHTESIHSGLTPGFVLFIFAHMLWWSL